MDELKDKTADLLEHAEDIAETYYKLAVVHVTEKATNIAAGTIMMVTSAVLGLLILFFLGLALSWWLGDLLENRTAGFLLGAGIYFLLLLFILLLKKGTIFPMIRNSIIRKVYEQED